MLSSLSLHADDATADAEPGWFNRMTNWVEHELANLGGDGEFNPDDGIDWAAVPGPFATPDSGFGLGVSSVGLFVVDKNDTVSQPSSITMTVFGSSKGNIGIDLDTQIFLQEDRRRLYIWGVAEKVHDVFYGPGIKKGKRNHNKHSFKLDTLVVNSKYLFQMAPAFYVGFGASLGQNNVKGSVDSHHTQPVTSSAFPQDVRTAGATFHAMYDSRDFGLNAKQGRLLQADGGFYNSSADRSHHFQKLALEYREYQAMGPGVLAFQLASEFKFGDVTWDNLTKLGGEDRLRGYTTGRYRGKQMLMSQVEYRHNLPGRHGMVYWLGAGTLGDDVSDLGSEPWIHSVGLGYRYELKPGVNLRADFAWGNGDSGIYVGVNEAF
ncbi:hypothetical protein EZMO1_4476 [Endozoicomonas montiporae CL-33]|uniref:Bacterial surface antigen (D15) domain-containing protein n=1 Tax=Endozoicomonas montiporae CL-33 TaxID=570277 RepID=A0A142BI15_9GAMM|nr:BamA/TamA family outer membrane protein [Endozoicomonas montiporae]AMO58391.1 hypothetical protein EZMO1_4476 [Endozoicomonas montiporae CL-33]